jgi:pimeloyl-ACP methyl ester carboxylesterase
MNNALDVEVLGKGPRIIFVHGSISDGTTAFAQQRSLAERWQLVILNRRGYGRSPPIERVEIETDAHDVVTLLGERAHLVGTSMGGIVAATAAAMAPDRILSLTLIEPPAFRNARNLPAVAEHAERQRAYWQKAAGSDPETFLRGFQGLMGLAAQAPSPLPPGLLVAARNLATERPWEAGIPIDVLAKTRFPKWIVTGGGSAVFEVVADRLASGLKAERRLFPGAPHAVQRIAPFNDALEAFLRSATAR